MDVSNTTSTVEVDLTPDLAARVDRAVAEIGSMDSVRTRAREELEKFVKWSLTEEEQRELFWALTDRLNAEKETGC